MKYDLPPFPDQKTDYDIKAWPKWEVPKYSLEMFRVTLFLKYKMVPLFVSQIGL